MNYRAFTIESTTGLLDEIIATVDVQQADKLCKEFNLQNKTTNVHMLLDTGASNSVISQRLAKDIGLSIADVCDVSGVGGVMQSNVYRVDIKLPNSVIISDVHVTEFVDNNQFDVIIGMDIITLGDLSITNHNSKTVVSFRIPPDTYHIDYVHMFNSSQSAKNEKDRLKKVQTRTYIK